MLEIIISMMILGLVLVGLINVFVVSRGYMAHSRYRVSASQLSRVFLDPLQNEVNQSTWDNASNKLTPNTTTGAPVVIDGVSYTPNYEITNETSPGSTLRKVKVNITWNEIR